MNTPIDFNSALEWFKKPMSFFDMAALFIKAAVFLIFYKAIREQAEYHLLLEKQQNEIEQGGKAEEQANKPSPGNGETINL